MLDSKFEDLVDLGEIELMRKVVEKEAEGIELENKSDDFVRGTFAHIMSIEIKNPAAEINEAVGKVREDAGDSGEDPIQAAMDRMLKERSTAWKTHGREVKANV